MNKIYIEKATTSMRLIFMTTAIGGVFLGLGWSLIYYLILVVSDTSVPILYALIYGLIMGLVLGIINGTILLLITGGKESSNTTVIISMGIMIIPIFLVSVLFSPSFSHLLVNVFIISLGTFYLTKYALRNKTTQLLV